MGPRIRRPLHNCQAGIQRWRRFRIEHAYSGFQYGFRRNAVMQRSPSARTTEIGDGRFANRPYGECGAGITCGGGNAAGEEWWLYKGLHPRERGEWGWVPASARTTEIGDGRFANRPYGECGAGMTCGGGNAAGEEWWLYKGLHPRERGEGDGSPHPRGQRRLGTGGSRTAPKCREERDGSPSAGNSRGQRRGRKGEVRGYWPEARWRIASISSS